MPSSVGPPPTGSGRCSLADEIDATHGGPGGHTAGGANGPRAGSVVEKGSTVSRLVSLVKRVGWIVVIALVVVATAGGSLIAVLTARGLPTTHGTLAIAGLDDAVRVTRDANGIAWIEADSAHDLFLAQGYVHAQERMWQMEVWRHISSGRLSELFGSSTLTEDRFIRTLGWRQAAERDLAALSPDARAVV